MGIKKMQGVSSHIEYIRKDSGTVEKVNCRFWKTEVCYNNISTKYGEICRGKRGCLYSLPIIKNDNKKKCKSVTSKIKDPINVVQRFDYRKCVESFTLIGKKKTQCCYDNHALTAKSIKLQTYKDKKCKDPKGFKEVKGYICTSCGNFFLKHIEFQELKINLNGEYIKQKQYLKYSTKPEIRNDLKTNRVEKKEHIDFSYFSDRKSGILPVNVYTQKINEKPKKRGRYQRLGSTS